MGKGTERRKQAEAFNASGPVHDRRPLRRASFSSRKQNENAPFSEFSLSLSPLLFGSSSRTEKKAGNRPRWEDDVASRRAILRGHNEQQQRREKEGKMKKRPEGWSVRPTSQVPNKRDETNGSPCLACSPRSSSACAYLLVFFDYSHFFRGRKKFKVSRALVRERS